MEYAERVRARYFNWLCSFTRERGHSSTQYSSLLKKLYSREFTWTIPMDENRAMDGMSLRDRYIYSSSLEDIDIECLNFKCTMLEMMVGLADRIERDITGDMSKGNDASKWFWTMIQSMQLEGFDNAHYDDFTVDRIINDCLMHRYDADGRGGLFHVPFVARDLRKLDIWYQMQAYLISVESDLEKENDYGSYY